MAAITAKRIFGGAADLEILHALEQAEQLLRLGVGVEPGAIERRESFQFLGDCGAFAEWRLANF